jgi:hypothetical protein
MLSARSASEPAFKTICDKISIFGMGSFFRGEQNYDDIDLVIVPRFSSSNYAQFARTLHEEFKALGDETGERFDLTILTENEFSRNPLRDMATLVPIEIT